MSLTDNVRERETEENINKIIHVSLCSRIAFYNASRLWSAWCENCKNIIHIKVQQQDDVLKKEIPMWIVKLRRRMRWGDFNLLAIALRGKQSHDKRKRRVRAFWKKHRAVGTHNIDQYFGSNCINWLKSFRLHNNRPRNPFYKVRIWEHNRMTWW